MTDRRGDWIQTYTGGAFWPLDPRPDEVRADDIAHALSMICRFTGHCRDFYSVAEHSVRVSLAMHDVLGVSNPRALLWGLLHDASEAYLCDVARPLKRLPEFAAYREIEALVQGAICRRFGLSIEPWPEVHRADVILLATEYRDLMIHTADPLMIAGWTASTGHIVPLVETISPWSPTKSRIRWLLRLESLSKAIARRGA